MLSQTREYKTWLFAGDALVDIHNACRDPQTLQLTRDKMKQIIETRQPSSVLNRAGEILGRLDKIEGISVNMMILGDLNTMGLKYPRQWKSEQIAKTITELDYIDYQCKKKGTGRYKDFILNMRRLSKPVGTYYSKTYGIADLDHIIASDNLEFKIQNNPNGLGNHEVLLDGWIACIQDEDRKKFVDEVSDHCLLFCELIVK